MRTPAAVVTRGSPGFLLNTLRKTSVSRDRLRGREGVLPPADVDVDGLRLTLPPSVAVDMGVAIGLKASNAPRRLARLAGLIRELLDRELSTLVWPV